MLLQGFHSNQLWGQNLCCKMIVVKHQISSTITHLKGKLVSLEAKGSIYILKTVTS